MKYQHDPEYLQNQAYGDAFDLNVRNCILTHYRAQAQGWYEWLFDQLRLPEDGRILELGCGPADLWQQNADRLCPGWHICLTDLSPGMVAAARQNVRSSAPGYSFAVLNSADLPFADETFAAVLAFGLLDHLPDRVRALAEIQRVMQPGSFFYASAGGETHLQQIETLLRPFLPEVCYGGDPERFGLHNGADFLAHFFTEIEKRPYEDTLIFTEPEPIAAYALSEPEVRQQLKPAQLEAFQKHLQQELRRQGEIRVIVQKGVFIAKKQAAFPG